MQWIFLIGNEDFNICFLKSLEYYESVSSYDVKEIVGRYCIDFGDEHIFFDLETDIDEFKDDLKSVPFTNPTIIMMTYTSKECARKVLSQKNFPQKIYIDNDLGSIVTLNEFIALGMPMA